VEVERETRVSRFSSGNNDENGTSLRND